MQLTPKLIHLVWIGDDTEHLQRRAEAWATMNPTWTTRAWTGDDLAPLIDQARAGAANVHPPDLVRHLANVCRWWLLANSGGVWVDVDTTPLRPLDPLLSDRPFTAAAGMWPAPFVCGGPAEHRLWNAALARSLDHPVGTSPMASGGRLLASVMRVGEIDLLPLRLFTAVDAMGAPLAEIEPRYSLHEWATSAQRHKEVPRGDQTRHAHR